MSREGPRVLVYHMVTPHIAGERARYGERVVGVFADDIGRWRRGETLRNLVDLAAGS